MSERPFLAILPKPLKAGDEIVLKGRIHDEAKQFSINFVLENNPTPSRIAYHLKTDFLNNEIVHNSKNCSWGEEIVYPNEWLKPVLPGEEFILTFHFEDSDIITYSGDDMREMEFNYIHRLPMSQITTVQVWDDIDYINEIIFRYLKE